jgi:hypothetical protein
MENKSQCGDSSTHVPAGFAVCQVHHWPKLRLRGGHDQIPVWALPDQRLLSDLLADTKLCDHVAIAIGIMRLQVVQQAAALAYEHQEATARCMVLLVSFEVLGQFANPLTQNRDLDFGGTGVRIVGAEAFNQ